VSADGDWRRRLERLEAVEEGGVRLYLARGLGARRKGLGALDDLPEDVGLLLRTRAIQTATMRFPLDLVWFDRRGEVVRVDRDVPPRRNRVCWEARGVVEVRAGQADRFIASRAIGYAARR